MATKKQHKVEHKEVAWRFAEPAKAIFNREPDAKYLGHEPVYPAAEKQAEWSSVEYKNQVLKTLNWYNYTQDSKKATEWLYQFLARNPRRAELADAVKRGEVWPGSTCGYILRAGRVGLVLRFETLRTIIQQLRKAEKNRNKVPATAPAKEEKPAKPAGPTIQDRLAEKTAECAGEIEGRFDTFITENEYKGEPKVVDLLSRFNVQPGHIKTIISLADRRIAEYTEVQTGKDSQLVEAYRHLGKRQITAAIKWWQAVQADCNSYGIIKKASKAPRKKKAVPPEKIVSKLNYLKEFASLKLKSIEPTQILQAQELWVYNTKTRKLGVYIVDTYAGTLGVKGTKIFGFDAAASVQKTLRKPETQLKDWAANGKPAAKKWFKGVRSTEIKLNGRINEDIILLKAYK